MSHDLFIHAGGPDLPAIATCMLGWPWFASDPRSLDLDDRDRKITPKWREQYVAVKNQASAIWKRFDSSGGTRLVTMSLRTRGRNGIVLAAAPDAFTQMEEILALLVELPFELASFRSVWEKAWEKLGAKELGFAQGHASHGWACAFRGAGHDRLVSRRWLDYGPWRVVRAAGDLTLVQFHDLDASPEEALAQAAPGHARMGIDDRGGFIQAIPSGYKLEGLYDPETRTFEVVVAGRPVTEGELLEACAIRWSRRAGDQPIQRVAYVFTHDQAAKAHLHELWLRELECWSVEGGDKRRLDLDYKPPAPQPPAWVTALG
jgi:hypothetical protein